MVAENYLIHNEGDCGWKEFLNCLFVVDCHVMGQIIGLRCWMVEAAGVDSYFLSCDNA